MDLKSTSSFDMLYWNGQKWANKLALICIASKQTVCLCSSVHIFYNVTIIFTFVTMCFCSYKKIQNEHLKLSLSFLRKNKQTKNIDEIASD